MILLIVDVDKLIDTWNKNEEFKRISRHVHNVSLLDIDKKYPLYCACKNVLELDGDVIEVGVYKGGSAYVISSVLGKTYCYDTFEGLPIRDKVGGSGIPAGHFKSNVEDVRDFLSGVDVELVKGVFPDSSLEHDKIKFLHLDVDIYKYTLQSLEHLYDKMVSGGIIIVDDYCWKDTPGVTVAIEEFFADKSEYPILMFGGQALVTI